MIIPDEIINIIMLYVHQLKMIDVFESIVSSGPSQFEDLPNIINTDIARYSTPHFLDTEMGWSERVSEFHNNLVI
tara:strand:- start:489 stop:713 length:225 start_codon:yes stop_codon:yes gene_type:complete